MPFLCETSASGVSLICVWEWLGRASSAYRIVQPHSILPSVPPLCCIIDQVRCPQVCGLYNPLQDDSVLRGRGMVRRLSPTPFQCSICKVLEMDRQYTALDDIAERPVTVEEAVLKKRRLQQGGPRGEAHTFSEICQGDQEGGELDEIGIENQLGSGDVCVSSCLLSSELEGRGQSVLDIACQSGLSDTSHEVETVSGDGDDEEDRYSERGHAGEEDNASGGGWKVYEQDRCAEDMSLSLGLSAPVATCTEKGDPLVLPRDRWKASSLPRSRVSDFIEAMVADRLKQFGDGNLMDSLTIRMVSNCMHNFEVPDVITNNLPTANGQRVQKYLFFKQKCILLFQKIDGVDVCLFCLYVQEFDNTCPEPNKSKVYIAYLDSVEYFRPRELRTTVYHEILVAYLKWSQARGFKQGHIWACPPQRGDNFIFWCHPHLQRTPSRDRLNGWYNTMLSRASGLGILSSVETLWASYFSAFGKREETAVRRASRNSFVAKNSVALAARRSSCGKREASSCGMTAALPVCPPLFEGDYWVHECCRIYNMVQMRAKGVEGQDQPANQRKCRDILKQMMAKPMAIAFNQPVDPVLLHIPDYPLIITQPMDLGTVRDTLRANGYRTILDYANVCTFMLCVCV